MVDMIRVTLTAAVNVMLSLDLSEARDVSERAARGDAEAIAFL
jgi:hypothetical protein